MKIALWRLRLWFKRTWRGMKWRLQSEAPPLREFVYVDEVSVYSLMSSRVGALPTEFTETQTNSMKSSSTGSIGIERLPLRASLGAAQEDSQSNSSQVIKKSTIQTTFREFHRYERSRLLLMPSEVLQKAKDKPRLFELGDLDKVARTKLESTWVVPVEELARGRLFEVDVRLSTSALFKFSTIFSTLSDIITETPELFPGVLDDQFATATSVNRVLNRLLVGLIPIEANVIDYLVVRDDAKAYVVHRSMLDEPALKGVPFTPLSVAGVTEQSLYWRDIRRILFAERTFRILGRIAETGLVETWRPVKLAEVLAEAVPTLTYDLTESAQLGLASFGANATRGLEIDEQYQVEESLRIYGELLKEELGLADSPGNLPPSLPRPLEGYGSMTDVAKRREAFRPVTEWYREKLDMAKITPDRVAAMRSEALQRAGFDERGSLIVPEEVTAPPLTSGDGRPLLLESEIVAIYW